MVSSLMKPSVILSGAVGMERLPSTLVLLDWLMMLMLVFVCGLIRFPTVKLMVSGVAFLKRTGLHLSVNRKFLMFL